MYLFLAVLGLHCTVGFPLVVLHELLVVLSLLLWSMSSRAFWLPSLQHMDSVVATPRLQITGSVVVSHRV